MDSPRPIISRLQATERSLPESPSGRPLAHFPDLNAARAVGSLCPSADLEVGAHFALARVKRRRPGEPAATVTTFIEGQTAGVLPGRARCRKDFLDSHRLRRGLQAVERMIAVVDQVAAREGCRNFVCRSRAFGLSGKESSIRRMGRFGRLLEVLCFCRSATW
jgi:hypothetical protein